MSTNLDVGIVGLPNVGKSTLFNAITKAGAEAANYPFCTIEPNDPSNKNGCIMTRCSRLSRLFLCLFADQHPAKRCFQAIRIEVNHELDGLETLLQDGIRKLNTARLPSQEGAGCARLGDATGAFLTSAPLLPCLCT